ncbi:hypothetical protein BC941DRAFT_423337 [Chlamydoabsidia padenii]|nr:hypothetical protein BC941DRAFT_423337 [Chlamydoabsidia padenii]
MPQPSNQERTTTSSATGKEKKTIKRLHVMAYALGAEGWAIVGIIVLSQWFNVNQGNWLGLSSELQYIVYAVVLYSTVLDLVMSYNVDRLACVQSLIQLYVTFGIGALFPSIQSSHIVYPCMLLVWSLNHGVNYGYSAAKAWFLTEQTIPPALTEARFSWFRFSYPASVFLEVMMAYLAMPLAKEWNKTYSIVMVLGAFAYIPGFPKLFKNMLVERRKYLQRQFLEKNK